jgi:chromate transporter
MHEELVARRQWVDEGRFQHALQFCILLPGPEAQQLATYLGWWLHGTRGGIAAGTLFVLPAAILLLVLSWGYALWGAVPWVSAALRGLQPAVVALMGVALIRLATRWLRTPRLWLMALGTGLGMRWGLPFPLLLLMAFLVGLLGQGILPAVAVSPPAEVGRPPTVPLATPLPDWKRSVRVFLICMVLWWMPVGLAAVWLGTEHVLVREGVFFSGASVMTFGGAYAVLPYVAQQAVEQFHWVSRSEMMAGMALAETTPGPLIIVLQFIGFLGAWHQPGFLSPGMSGILGAGMTSWTTFFPSFLWIFLGAPWVERLQGLKQWERWVGVVSAGVVGMILHLAWGLGVSALGIADGRLDGPAVTILLVAFGLMRWGQWPSGAVILLSGVLGILRSKLGL